MELEERLIRIMQTYEPLMKDLKVVRQLELPNWWIAAGYVRNFVWDRLHGYSERTPLNDVDVLYFDPGQLSEEQEKGYEACLRQRVPEYNWSCKNQARMHLRNRQNPYASVADAMKRWPETATAVGISLDLEDRIQILAPHGLDDLFELIVRRSLYFQDRSYYLSRVYGKKWLEKWPKLRLAEEK